MHLNVFVLHTEWTNTTSVITTIFQMSLGWPFYPKFFGAKCHMSFLVQNPDVLPVTEPTVSKHWRKLKAVNPARKKSPSLINHYTSLLLCQCLLPLSQYVPIWSDCNMIVLCVTVSRHHRHIFIYYRSCHMQLSHTCNNYYYYYYCHHFTPPTPWSLSGTTNIWQCHSWKQAVCTLFKCYEDTCQ